MYVHRVPSSVGVKDGHSAVTFGPAVKDASRSAMITDTVAVFRLYGGRPMLLTVRFLVSAEFPRGVDGRYYWEHCLWVDRDDWPNDSQMVIEVRNTMRILYTEQVQLHGARYFHPISGDLYLDAPITTPFFGSQEPVTSPNLLICARWRMWGADGSYTYHLHRMPVGDEHLIDGVWSDFGFTEQQTRMNTYIGDHPYRTHTGSLIDRGELAPLPVMWQLRHGTKRRRRRFWLSA